MKDFLLIINISNKVKMTDVSNFNVSKIAEGWMV